MTTRHDDARALAKAIGWPRFFAFDAGREGFNRPLVKPLALPLADAPLHRHLAFVGRVALALYPRSATDRHRFIADVVRLTDPNDTHPDYARAAMLLAVAEKEAAR